jgi:antitoxin YefM
MQTLTASEARANLYRLIDQAAELHQPITITGKRANAVLLSAEDWSAIQETLYLLGVPGMRESILYPSPFKIPYRCAINILNFK